MMRSLLLLFAIIAMATSFTPTTNHAVLQNKQSNTNYARTTTSLNIDMGEPEREALTRESEPDEFFSTNTDKMSDEDKIPIAIAGVLGISLPFIAGMIALYAAK